MFHIKVLKTKLGLHPWLLHLAPGLYFGTVKGEKFSFAQTWAKHQEQRAVFMTLNPKIRCCTIENGGEIKKKTAKDKRKQKQKRENVFFREVFSIVSD